MKKILLLIPAIIAIAFGKVSGTYQVDFGIFASTTANQMEIRIRPNYAEDGTRYITNAQFTVKWPTSSGIDTIFSGSTIYPYNFTPQGPTLTDNGYYYQIYATAGGNALTWSADQEIVVQTFTFTSPPCPSFEIADDDYVKNIVNGAFYFEINGSDKTGILYNSPAQQPSPGDAGTITGTATICQSQSGVAYSVPAITNATSYTWAYSGTGATINGTTNSITIDFSSSATSGDLTVYGVNGCGNGTVSANYAITVNVPPSITGQPVSPAAVCAGTGTPSFTVTATGAGLTYQWQEYITSWINVSNGGVYSGALSATLTITNPPSSMNGYKYRCVVTGTCTPAATSDGLATLIVNTAPAITGQPSAQTVCAGSGQATYTVIATGSGLTYQWQEFISTWTNLSNGGVYAGVLSATLTITNPPESMDGYQYRCVVSGSCVPPATSNAAVLNVDEGITIDTQPADQIVCVGNNASFSVSATGTITGYQWQEFTTSWNNLNNNTTYGGVTTSTLSITGATAGMNGNNYRCIITGSCGTAQTDGLATLTVNTPSAPTVGTITQPTCA
ncbi:MAG: hypothetical protein NT175_14620, partial [Bacteroidetes bacterium]|nr:hypothetical protein [Bacteroidota bacterium]